MPAVFAASPPDYITTREAAALLRLSRSRVDALRADPASGFPAARKVHPGKTGRALFKRVELLDWIEARTTPTTKGIK